MKYLTAIKSEYSQLKINKDVDFCHSMDKEGYKILYKNFFADKRNKNLAILIAEETSVSSNQSEKLFLQWLKVE